MSVLIGLLGAYEQWGNAGNGGGSVDVTFPISFTKTVYQIQLTCNSDSYENPVYAIKDTKSFSYWSKYGGDKLWFALGMQQWGVSTTSFPLSVSEVYSINASKKDTGANSVPDVQNYSSTGFAYYGPSPYAWFAVCKAQQWGYVSHNNVRSDTPKVAVFPISFTKTIYTISTQLHMTNVRSDLGTGPYIVSYSNNQMSILFNIESSGVIMDGAWWLVIGR